MEYRRTRTSLYPPVMVFTVKHWHRPYRQFVLRFPAAQLVVPGRYSLDNQPIHPHPNAKPMGLAGRCHTCRFPRLHRLLVIRAGKPIGSLTHVPIRLVLAERTPITAKIFHHQPDIRTGIHHPSRRHLPPDPGIRLFAVPNVQAKASMVQKQPAGLTARYRMGNLLHYLLRYPRTQHRTGQSQYRLRTIRLIDSSLPLL